MAARSSRSGARKTASPRKAAPSRKAPAADVDDDPKFPSAEERKGMRAHDDQGNVRPADGRWDLHEPKDEGKHVRMAKAD